MLGPCFSKWVFKAVTIISRKSGHFVCITQKFWYNLLEFGSTVSIKVGLFNISQYK